MSNWGRSEFRPGPESSLDELHARVPAAEEVDLAEEVHAEQFARWAEDLVLGQLRRLGEEPPDQMDEPAPTDEGDAADSPTPGQALGLLEHLLGAVEIEE